ncbi:transposase [Methylomarinum vadi]
MWAYRSNNLQRGPPIIVFDYQAGDSYARQFLDNWQGHLLVDNYSG